MRFTILVPVVTCKGTQCYEVEAKDEDEARAKWNTGEVVFVAEEIEVTHTGDPEFRAEDI